MTPPLLYALTGALLFVAGLAGMVLQSHVLRKVLAFNIMGSGAFLALVGMSQRNGEPDPVAQAMVLTGIVVAIASTALTLGLARRLLNLTGRMRLPAQDPDD